METPSPDPPPAAAPNRRVLQFELIIVLLAIWAPLFTAGMYWRGLPVSWTLESEVIGIVTQVGWISLIVFLVWRNKESLTIVGIRATRWWAEALWGVAILFALLLATVAVDTCLYSIGGIEPPPNTERATTEAKGALLFLFLGISALFEELFIRGYLWTRLVQLTGRKWFALVVSAVFFAAYHPYQWDQLLMVFVFGLVLGCCFWAGRSLPRLVVGHLLFNLMIFSQ